MSTLLHLLLEINSGALCKWIKLTNHWHITDIMSHTYKEVSEWPCIVEWGIRGGWWITPSSRVSYETGKEPHGPNTTLQHEGITALKITKWTYHTKWCMIWWCRGIDLSIDSVISILLESHCTLNSLQWLHTSSCAYSDI